MARVITFRLSEDVIARLEAFAGKAKVKRNRALQRLLELKLPPLEGVQPPPAGAQPRAKTTTPKRITQAPAGASDEVTDEDMEASMQSTHVELDRMKARSREGSKEDHSKELNSGRDDQPQDDENLQALLDELH